jgi:hypothetical protein
MQSLQNITTNHFARKNLGHKGALAASLLGCFSCTVYLAQILHPMVQFIGYSFSTFTVQTPLSRIDENRRMNNLVQMPTDESLSSPINGSLVP